MRIDPAFAESVLKRALSSGAEQAEIFVRYSRGLTVEVKDRAVDSLKSSRSFGYGLRVIRRGSPGFSYSNRQEDADMVVSNAVGAAAYADPDIHLDFPEASSAGDVAVQDPAVESIDGEEAIRMAISMEDSARNADSRVSKVRKAAGSFAASEMLVLNTKSLRAGYRSTACSAQITVVAEEGGDAQAGFDYTGGRFLSDISFEQTGINAALHACSLLGARKISARKAAVLLDSSVAVDFLGILAGSISADQVQKGKSLLSGRQGERIISPKVRILDDGLLPGRPGSCPVDDEGVPSQRKVVFGEGVLQGYLHNTYTARKGAVLSTGNASRGGYASVPSVGVSNLYIEPASDGVVIPRVSLFRAAGSGLYVLDAMGVHTANPVTGDFSVGVTGLWIEDGVVSYPVKEAVISGNVLELFSSIEAVGDDLRFYGSLGSPSLVITEMDISA